jgi:hypothetical protein
MAVLLFECAFRLLLVIDRPFVNDVPLLVCLEGGLTLRTVVPKLMGCAFLLGAADTDGRRPPDPDGRAGRTTGRVEFILRRAVVPEFVLGRVIGMA